MRPRRTVPTCMHACNELTAPVPGRLRLVSVTMCECRHASATCASRGPHASVVLKHLALERRAWRLGYLAGQLAGKTSGPTTEAAWLREAAALLNLPPGESWNSSRLLGLGTALLVSIVCMGRGCVPTTAVAVCLHMLCSELSGVDPNSSLQALSESGILSVTR